MTDKERIERLEQMVFTLATTVKSLVGIINTGSYEYSLGEVEAQLREEGVTRFTYKETEENG